MNFAVIDADSTGTRNNVLPPGRLPQYIPHENVTRGICLGLLAGHDAWSLQNPAFTVWNKAVENAVLFV